MIWKRGSRYAKEKEKQNRGRLKGKCEVFLAAACAWPLPENIGAATKRENERESLMRCSDDLFASNSTTKCDIAVLPYTEERS